MVTHSEREEVASEFWKNADTIWEARWEQVWAFFNAVNKSPVPLLWEALRKIPPSIGKIIREHDTNDNRLIAIFRSSPANPKQRMSIGRIIKALIDTGCITFVAGVGGVGEYDLSLFTSIEQLDTRREVVDYFVKYLRVSGPEYGIIISRRHRGITIIGVEDKDLFLKATEARATQFPYAVDGESFLSLNEKRSQALAENTLRLLTEREEPIAVQEMAYLASQVVERTYAERGVSFVVIEPFTDEPDNMELYEKAIRGEGSPLEMYMRKLIKNYGPDIKVVPKSTLHND